MQDFTFEMVNWIDEDVNQVTESLKDLQEHVTPESLKFVEECQFEIKKLRYRIRDYLDIHSIIHSDFE